MRRLPSTLAALTAAVALTAAPAAAAGCPLLTDPAGDSAWLQTPVQSPVWDVRSADLATGPTTLVVVLRVESLSTQGADGAFARGTIWAAGWTLGGTRHSVHVIGALVGGTGSSYYERSSAAGRVRTPVAVTLNEITGTVTWTVPRSAVPELATPGGAFSDLTGVTTYQSGSADMAFVDGVVYTDGDPGCVSAS